eukprot:CAMPEP_0194743354 /NCGR_PEP_ID=MMETSP0296-20130528/100264_1 /TAXON_ID=39354 /ORGANISM="Heterosigma akashiwo, Strain CCMP2393" /LENGTH=70 /DNA_ID=CAMNT_0039655371 /DNA_START=399 /DNA_END=612 /DNA_ORIENTATION=+
MDKAIQDRLLLVAVFGREVLGWEKELVKVVVERRVGHQVNYEATKDAYQLVEGNAKMAEALEQGSTEAGE